MYRALRMDEPRDPDALRIWETKLPTKVKFFGWLLHHERLNSRSSLFHRNIRRLDESYCESCPNILETPEHIFADCPCAMRIWQILGVVIQPGGYRQPWLLGCDLNLPPQAHVDVILLILWHVWKARNALIFDQKSSTATTTLRRVIDDLDSWSCRLKNLKGQIQVWRNFLYSRI